jgi:hypothetical protein
LASADDDQPAAAAMSRRFVFPYVTETLRTESFLTNMQRNGCFSLTDMVAAMNSGIRVRESIHFIG